MPEDKANRLPDEEDIKGPPRRQLTQFILQWVHRPRVTPKEPKVQPGDSTKVLKSMDKPEIRRSIGTDKPERPK